LKRDEVIVSISPVPKVPWPVSKFHRLGLTPLSAEPLKSSAQTCFQGGGAVADEQPVITRTVGTLSQAASLRSRREAPVRSVLFPP
jgi:hypothetical protein